MALQCQICNQNDIKYRCPKCGRLICENCQGQGVCSVCCTETLPAPPAVNAKPKSKETDPRLLGFLLGVLLGVIGGLIGLVMYLVCEEERKKIIGGWAFVCSLLWLALIALCYSPIATGVQQP